MCSGGLSSAGTRKLRSMVLAYFVHKDSFGPTGNMMRRDAVRTQWRPMRSVRKWRYPAFWWRLYPRTHVEWYRGVLRRDVKPKR